MVVGLLGIFIGILLTISFSNRSDPKELTSRELSVALGLHHWRFRIPEDAGKKFLGFEVHDGDVLDRSGRSNGWIPGETILVTVRPLMDNKKLECSLVGQSGNSRALLDNPFSDLSPLHYTPDGRFVNEVPLVKANRNGAVVTFPVNDTEPGDVTLRLAFSE